MSAGLAAPDGYLWARGRSRVLHFLRAHELTHQGKARATARSVCGLWASLSPEEDGWAEVAQRAIPEPRQMCAGCLAGVADAQRRDRLATPPAAQTRLW
jgi:hypothetical protein